MKYIIAMVQPHKLPDVKQALFDAGIKKMTVTNVLGCGQQGGYEETYRGVPTEINLIKKVKIEIGLNDEYVQKAIDAITKGARSGNIGDGKIFVLELPQCVRIRTGETGIDAIG